MSLRIGIVGAGNMARAHAEGWDATQDRIVAVFSASRERADRFAAAHDATVAEDFGHLASMVDVVDICAPTHTHSGYISDAISAGLDIVCEKPLARTGADAFEAVEACDAAGVQLLVGHVLRFFPEYARARELVVSGDIGEIGVVRLDRSTYLPAGASAWFTDIAKSGGVVLDLMIHDVDYARWVAGDVERVYAKRAGGADHVLATLRHTNGAISHLQGSWAYPEGSFRASFEIAGSDGLVQQRATSGFTASGIPTEGIPDVPDPTSSAAESPFVAEMQHFSEVLHGRAEPKVTGMDGANAVAVCEAVAESIDTGLSIAVTQ